MRKTTLHRIHPMPHIFYLARCADGSLYAGTCVDVAARERKHNDGSGAKYTRSRRPITIVYTETFATLGEARRREAAVKRWNKAQKEALITVPVTSARPQRGRSVGNR